MIVKKFNKTLHIRLEPDDDTDIVSIANNDALFWSDIRVVSSGEWLYLKDDNRNEVCMVSDYGFNLMDELSTGKTIVFHYIKNEPDYEFNNEE